MKKLFSFALIAAIAMPLFAQDAEKSEAPAKEESAIWPACIAFCEWPASPDVVGIRFTIPYSTRQESITGIDLGFWGRSMYFEGIQVSIIRNDVKDAMAGFQVGIYNSVGRGDLLGVQAGLWNEAGSLRGVQAGLINIAGEAEGFQIGLINRAETMHGVQVGLVNVIREAEIQFCPVFNIGF